MKTSDPTIVVTTDHFTLVPNSDGTWTQTCETTEESGGGLSGGIFVATFSSEPLTIEGRELDILKTADKSLQPRSQVLAKALAPSSEMTYQTKTIKVIWKLEGSGGTLLPEVSLFMRPDEWSEWAKMPSVTKFSFEMSVNDVLPKVTLEMLPL